MTKPLRRITCVEDESDIRAVMEMALTRIGKFEIDLCTSGPEAIRRTPDFQPDLILLDVMMPGMTGIEVFDWFASIPELWNTPVIFLTAKIRREEVRYYRELGAIGVIAKPFDPATLHQTIAAIWGRHQDEAA